MSDDFIATKASLRSLRSNAFNLQTMLRMASKGQNTSKILDKISPAIQSHVARVEALKIKIPEENKHQHRSLVNYIKLIEADWRMTTLSDTDYADALNFKLYNHFSIYFKPLLDAHLGEDLPLDFRL